MDIKQLLAIVAADREPTEAAYTVLAQALGAIPEEYDQPLKQLLVYVKLHTIARSDLPEVLIEYMKTMLNDAQGLSDNARNFYERAEQVIERTHQMAERAQRQIDTLERHASKLSRKGRPPGPRTLAVNTWAREQIAAGRTLDELLPEYARRRQMTDMVQARELLRKAVKGIRIIPTE